MYQLTENRKKIAIIAAILALIFTIGLGAYWIKRSSDGRSKALTANQVQASFDQATYQLPAVGTEFKADVMLEVIPTNNVTAAAITLQYPTSVLTLNTLKTEKQAANASDQCNMLDQTITSSFDEGTGTVKLVKASYADDTKLPTGKFCFGTIFFTVKAAGTSTDVLKFSGDVTKLTDWDVVGKIGRYQVLLASPSALGTGGTTNGATVNVKFGALPASLPVIGQTFTLPVNFTISSPAVGGAITFTYPTTALEFDETQTETNAKAAADECGGLDQVILVSDDTATGVGKLVKLTYKADADLPSGTFCYAKLYFKVKAAATAADTIKFSGSTTDVKDWDIVTKAGRATPTLGPAVALVGGTVTPVATTTVMPSTTTNPTTSTSPTTSVNPSLTPTPINCSNPPSIYSCQQLKTGSCQVENKPDGSTCRVDTTAGVCQAGTCIPGSGTPTATPGNDCPRRPEGDANCDGFIKIDDFEQFRSEYIAFHRGLLNLYDVHADFNDDGFIDIEDFAIFRTSFLLENNSNTPTATPVNDVL
jgi:hypothetical protein